LWSLETDLPSKCRRKKNEEFGLPEDEIKELYQWWKQLDKRQIDRKFQKQYSIILTAPETRSITDFRGKLRYIKGLKRELEGNKWVSNQFRHSDDVYGKSVIDADQLINEDEEDLSIPNAGDEDIPL